jgi:hypothetical protein
MAKPFRIVGPAAMLPARSVRVPGTPAVRGTTRGIPAGVTEVSASEREAERFLSVSADLSLF